MNLLKSIVAGTLLYTGAYANNIITCKENVPSSIKNILEKKIKTNHKFGAYNSNDGSITYNINDNNIFGSYASFNEGTGTFNCSIKKLKKD